MTNYFRGAAAPAACQGHYSKFEFQIKVLTITFYIYLTVFFLTALNVLIMPKDIYNKPVFVYTTYDILQGE